MGPAFAATNLSSWVFPGVSGRLLARPDFLGNRVVDVSGVGYKGGLVPLPGTNLVVVRTNIAPVGGDNGSHIQGAINYVQSLPLDSNGFRGAVLLAPGEYPLAGSVTISASGVVLRGSGSGTNGTVLRATATNQYSLVRVTGSGSASTVSGTTHDITNFYTPVGARSFLVDSTSGLAVGDRVFVRRVATQQWIDDLGMNLLCCPPDVNPWTPSGYHIDMDRVITRIEGSRVFIDAPVTCAIDRGYTNGTIRKYTWSTRIQNSGVEHLRGVSDYAAADDEEHGWVFVQFNSIEHGWARNLVSQYFGYACVALYGGSRFVTVSDSQALDPISIVTGGRRYAFVMDDCTMCLVKNCYIRQDRHQFVTQSLTTGPNVFVDGLSDSARSDAGPHHRWATVAVWDNITVNGNNLNIQNRGNSGSGHGWAGGNCVVYNCDADGGYVVQNPPTARNWLIGSTGAIENGTAYVGPHDPGTYDSHGTNVFPNSLYYAQLQDRLAAPNLKTREYWLGEIDRFDSSGPPGESVPVDAAWQTAITTAAAGQPVNGFDVVTNAHWVPFTFSYSLAVTDRVVAASLTLCLRSTSGGGGAALYLDATNNAFSFASLGLSPVTTSSNASNATVRVLDLTAHTNLLADGKLNLAIAGDVGIDWALLQLEVAPALNIGAFPLAPVADATVRGGASAGSNFGSTTTLTVKEDASADNDRRAYLRWDLSSVTGAVYHAAIRLTAVSVGTNNLECGIAVSTSNPWSEAGITWNNQPGAGKRFATRIPGTNQPVDFVVTPQVLEALAGDKQLSVQLYSLRDIGGAGLADFASREAADPATRPQLLLTAAQPPPQTSGLTWNGDVNADWNTATPNWKNNLGTGLVYSSGDAVLFNDSASGATNINLTTLTPGGVTVSNASKAFAFVGGGRLSGGTGLLKQGAGALLIANEGVNDFTGGVRIEGGEIQVGTGGTNGTLGSGAITNHGTLIYHRSDQITLGNALSGAGTLIKTNSNTILITNASSAFTGLVKVNSGVLRANTSAQAFGAGLVNVADGAVAYLNVGATYPCAFTIAGIGVPEASGNFGAIRFAANGAAITNSVTLAGNARITARNATSTGATLSGPISGGYPLEFNNCGDNTGVLTISNPGNSWSGGTIVSHGTLRLGASEVIPNGVGAGSVTLSNTSALFDTLLNLSGFSETINGLNSAGADPSRCIVTNGSVTAATLIVGDGDANGAFGGVIKNGVGTVALTKTGSGTQTLDGLNSCTGATTVNAGTLGGNGTVGGTLLVNSGGTLAPGNSLGTFTASNSVTLLGTTAMELNAALATNDVLRSAAGISFGGALQLTNLGGAFTTNHAFKLFSAASYSGAFASISPVIPAMHHVWNTNTLTTDGTLRIVSAPTPPPVIVAPGLSGTNLIFAGTNGVPGWPCLVLTTTNLIQPLSAWEVIGTNVFDGSGSLAFTNGFSAGTPQRFYRLEMR